MPQIQHYEVTVRLRFEIDGPLAYHEAVQIAEGRASKALKGEGPSHSDPVHRVEIIAVSADDLTIRPRPAGSRG